MCFFDDKHSRTWTNNNTDGSTFYGYDDNEGQTTWYDEDGNFDSITSTPSDWEQEMNDAGY